MQCDVLDCILRQKKDSGKTGNLCKVYSLVNSIAPTLIF